jgi:acyl-[acyl-carrier protein] desaturase
MPVLKKWRIFERDDFTGEATRMRDDIALLVKELETACDKFEVSKQRYLEREARKSEGITAAKALKTNGTLSMSRH